MASNTTERREPNDSQAREAERGSADACADCGGTGRMADGTSCKTCGWSDEGGTSPESILPH